MNLLILDQYLRIFVIFLISVASLAPAKHFNTSSEAQETSFSFKKFCNLFTISSSDIPSALADCISSDISPEYFSNFNN